MDWDIIGCCDIEIMKINISFFIIQKYNKPILLSIFWYMFCNTFGKMKPGLSLEMRKPRF